MRIRALGVLGTAAILATASTSWGQDAQAEASDAATVSDAALGESEAAEEGAARGDDIDGGAEGGSDDSSGSAGESGSASDPGSAIDTYSSSGADGDSPSPSDPGMPGPVMDPGSGAGSAGSPGNEPATENGQTTANEGSSGDDAAEGPTWGDAAPPATNLDAPKSRAVIGCGGCSTGDPGASGVLALLFAVIAVAWRARRSDRGPGT